MWKFLGPKKAEHPSFVLPDCSAVFRSRFETLTLTKVPRIIENSQTDWSRQLACDESH
ncbi:hypothetical protein METBIDRAFT_30996 [Metschnikowia bicuspidata var. bicuspidata NRRL YB-4993]|uniref:Uncharacterized protein n=1 Tax=Metschnikowia bicuspidata var. bicuspidata NRRL YB-4993 TaxID=869754 RepID=A0A1A0HD66_9ASCO|nr:hypothetical protein METBIDRAFT_30996 [Metschnikowia bicuspidata var. bicuspidata NRRL YB-4993]OBA22024.1 hypothetical protein METBIDRAFT_30996 [Metschnikowia bicuspidata var. bicuspidata NRRL YB-4993]